MSHVALAVLHLAAAPAAQDSRDLPAPSGPLLLTCAGLATNPVGDPRSGTASRSGRKSSTASRKAKSHDSGSDDERGPDDGGDVAAPPAARAGHGTPVEFRFEFAGDHGRVLYPAAIIPVMHSGGDRDGWWPVRDLAASDEAFSGRVVLNFINHARFTIDRHTGQFNLVGLQANVTGRCARAERGPRLF